MKIFVVTIQCNYGELVSIINAESLDDVKNITKKNNYDIWPCYEIRELSREPGIVFEGGGSADENIIP